MLLGRAARPLSVRVGLAQPGANSLAPGSADIEPVSLLLDLAAKVMERDAPFAQPLGDQTDLVVGALLRVKRGSAVAGGAGRC